MQSYLDFSIIAVIVVTVVILLFILISFLINSHRASSIEKGLHSTISQLEIKISELATENEKIKTLNDSLERRVKSSERSLQYVTDTLQDLIDKQRKMDSSFDSLSNKIELQKKEFEEKSVDNQPLVLAKRLLSEGMNISDVIERTGLPSYEVEMLAKVHKLDNSSTPKSIEEQVRSQTEKFISSPSVNLTEPKVMQSAPKTAHVASLKARDAYGIGTKSVLRRQR